MGLGALVVVKAVNVGLGPVVVVDTALIWSVGLGAVVVVGPLVVVGPVVVVDTALIWSVGLDPHSSAVLLDQWLLLILL